MIQILVFHLLDSTDLIRTNAEATSVLIEALQASLDDLILKQEAMTDSLQNLFDLPSRIAAELREEGNFDEAESVEQAVDEWIDAKLAREAGAVE